MSKLEWGVKRTCPGCNVRFYDMNKQPITCPKCSNVFDPDAFVKKPTPPDAEDTITLELEEEMEPLVEADDVLEDTSDFGEDEEVVGIETTEEED